MRSALGNIYHSHIELGSNILFTAEHASWRIPRELKNLGVSREDLHNTSDLYDIGSLELMQYLASNFHASYIFSNVSRLVIDTNRYFEAPTEADNDHIASLVKKKILTIRGEEEVSVQIPHNVALTKEDEWKLYQEVCQPYQQHLRDIVEKLREYHKKVYVISIHSFAPLYNGNERKLDIGILPYTCNHAEVMLREVQKNSPSLDVRLNEPWAARDADGGALHIVHNIEGVDCCILETKNTHLNSSIAISHIGDFFSESIHAAHDII